MTTPKDTITIHTTLGQHEFCATALVKAPEENASEILIRAEPFEDWEYANSAVLKSSGSLTDVWILEPGKHQATSDGLSFRTHPQSATGYDDFDK